MSFTRFVVLEVAGRTYTKRQFTPKGDGVEVGHGWVRDVGAYQGRPGSEHQAEIGLKGKQLLDEIDRLRGQVVDLEREVAHLQGEIEYLIEGDEED